VSLFVSPSQALIDLHVAAGYARRRFRLLRNGILHEHFAQPSTDRVRDVAQDRGLYRSLLFAGAIVESKGVATLLRALPLLERYVDRLCLLVAGWGDQVFVNALQRHAPSPVRMLGKVPFYEMGTLYSAADLTLVPSVWYDNSPTVIYESLLGGTPVLASAIGGIPELIREGETGYLVPAGDPVALAEGVIQHFARSPLERRRMRLRCTLDGRQQFDIDVHLDGLLPVYREAVDKQSAQEEG
jgi:glycosyltransferase involved in cell wall biosynthesis